MSTRRRCPASISDRVLLAHVRPDGADETWLRKWAPTCPDANPQRLGQILGFRLKGEDYLQLRVVMRQQDGGVCQAVIDEHHDTIYVRAIVCMPQELADGPRRTWWGSEEVDSPCNVWLDTPLGERVVIDVDTHRELPLYIPRWGTDKPSLYVARPRGTLWPPNDAPPLPPTGGEEWHNGQELRSPGVAIDP